MNTKEKEKTTTNQILKKIFFQSTTFSQKNELSMEKLNPTKVRQNYKPILTRINKFCAYKPTSIHALVHFWHPFLDFLGQVMHF